MLRLIIILSIISSFGVELSAQDLLNNGREKAEQDYSKSGPKIGSWGTEVCVSGYGLDKKTIDQYKYLPAGPSYCGCIGADIVKKHDYIKEYNKRMIELIEKDSE